MYSILRRRITGIRQAMMDFLVELVQTPSVSLEEGPCAARIAEEMRCLGYDRTVCDEAGNVVGVIFGRSSASSLLLNTHMDTVPPGSVGDWADSPYSGCIAGGKVYGRGAADCKGGIAAQVYAGGVLKRSLLPLEENVVVAVTVAEENGCSLGVRHLLDHTLPSLGLEPTAAVLAEPTRLGLFYGHDGWLEIEVHIGGGNPFHVNSAADAVFRSLNGLERTSTGIGTRREHVTVQTPAFSNAGHVRAATVKLDRRLREGETIDEVIAGLQQQASQAAEGAGVVAVETVVRTEKQRLYTGQAAVVRRVAHAWTTDPFDPLVTRTRQVLEAAGIDVVPGKWRLGRLGMGTAGGVLVNEYDVPTVGFGPGDEEMAHACNECVDLEAIETCVYGTAVVAHGLAGIPVFGWSADEI